MVSYVGVRHRPELNKWVTEIRPTAQKRKIWLGTYKTPEEAARAYDVGIYYTGKKIPLNFPDSVPDLPALPCASWEENAPFVKKQAVFAAKRARADKNNSGRVLAPSISSRG
jgi:EREBP-like factor